jgi:hypothetical protein
MDTKARLDFSFLMEKEETLQQTPGFSEKADREPWKQGRGVERAVTIFLQYSLIKNGHYRCTKKVSLLWRSGWNSSG